MTRYVPLEAALDAAKFRDSNARNALRATATEGVLVDREDLMCALRTDPDRLDTEESTAYDRLWSTLEVTP